MITRTRSFNIATGQAASNTSYLVWVTPGDATVIIKSVSLVNPSASAAYVNVRIGASTVLALNFQVPNAGGVHSSVWVVLEAGWHLYVDNGPASGMNYSFSGALLPGEAEAGLRDARRGLPRVALRPPWPAPAPKRG